ncbi:hypothetical protein QTN25_006524 [Entamoeba marina]
MNNTKQLDSYSMLIVSKYFSSDQDYLNTICVNSKFKETTEKLRFNPILITSLKLFPKIQTQYLYTSNDKMIIGIEKYKICYEVDYKEYLKLNKSNTTFCYVRYTHENRKQYGNTIPNGVTTLDNFCFIELITRKTIIIPNTIHSIGSCCFYKCINLKSVTLPYGLKELSNGCFSNCVSLESINIPSTIQVFDNSCFYNCSHLKTIDFPSYLTRIGFDCFYSCKSLKSITIPSSIVELEYETFCYCSSLTSVEFPTTLISIEDLCFSCCQNLISITLPISLRKLGRMCFSDCRGLLDVCCVNELEIGENCFENCYQLQIQPKQKRMKGK